MAKEKKTAKVKTEGKSQTGAQSVHMLRSFAGPASSKLDKRLAATYATYREIRRHPTVALTRALSIAPIVAAEWSFEADDDVDDDRVRFIQDQVKPIREAFLQAVMEHRVDYGWCAFEKVYEHRKWEGGDRIWLKTLKPLLVDITNILVDSDTGNFGGFEQPPSQGGGANLTLELPYALLVSFEVEGSNWYGRPLLENIRVAYLNWKDANDGAERYDKKIAGPA